MKISIVHKFSLVTILFILISSGLVSWVFYYKTTEVLVLEALEDISTNIRHAGERLNSHITTQREDILFLSSAPAIQGILRAQKTANHESQGDSSYKEWTSKLELIFKTMLHSKNSYLKIRFIDVNGQELVVVGREDDKIIGYHGNQLQNKSKRNYVQETIKLSKGSVYLSEINLNREFGKVSLPHQQVIRTASPVYDKQNDKVAGLVLVTAEIGHELQSIQSDVYNSTNNIYITNDHGGYLLHPNRDKSYGFDLGKRYRIQEDFPYLAPLFLPGNKDSVSILRPKDVGGENVINFGKIYFDSSKPDRFIAVGMTESYNAIVSRQSSVLNDVLVIVILVTILSVFFAIIFSYHISIPIKNITQVIDDHIHQRTSSAILPVKQNDEIGLLARSFNLLLEEVDEAKANLEESNRTLEFRVIERTAALEISEARQRSIVENIVDGLITINQYGKVKSFNPAAVKIFGYQVDEVIGNNVKMLMPEPFHSEHDGYLKNYAQSAEKKIIGIGREVEGRRKDGSIFPLELAVSEILVNNKKIYTGIVRDITERKQMDKMKNEFISTVSHELRTPLTSIRGSLGLLSSGTVGELPESAKEMLKIASNNTERLLLLINDILDIQKIESGKMSFKFESVDLSEFINEAIVAHTEYGKQHGVTFVLGNKLENVRIFADKDRLMQVMGNLLSNAAKFSHEGDHVDISVAVHNSDRLRISITDYGSGIPDEFQPKLFERFTQSDSSDTRAKGGTGLGLSISKVIIEKHGGLIGFISKEGIGSTFYIELPELVGEVSSSDSMIFSLPEDRSSCVLIVEDDSDVAALIRRMLAEAGYNSDIAYDARQARQLLAERKDYYRLITLDILLPDEDGISLLSSLRKNPETTNIPVVVLSVKANEVKRELQGGALDVADWLSKPIDNQRLIDVVTRVVKTNKQTRVLHVEDEKDVHTVVKQMLQDHCELLWTTTVSESRQIIKQGNIDLVLLDVRLPDGSGLDLIEDIERLVPQPQVVIFSAMNVSDKYADRVDAVLVKSQTNNAKLLQVLLGAMK